jgi:EAL domain-containing protein (putative c-di-GMP-specific phosphodiesterase class I)
MAALADPGASADPDASTDPDACTRTRTSTSTKTFAMHVNLSARQIHRPDLISDVAAALRKSRIPAERLTLELTESALGTDHQAAARQLDRLSQLGVHLAIDDFGTGYSSLAYLRSMPVDVLKIDKSFTEELRADTGSAPLAQAVIALASALRMRTVAEGIEDPTQARRLLALGCQHGQGYHYARALPADQMGALLGVPSETELCQRGAEPVERRPENLGTGPGPHRLVEDLDLDRSGVPGGLDRGGQPLDLDAAVGRHGPPVERPGR